MATSATSPGYGRLAGPSHPASSLKLEVSLMITISSRSPSRAARTPTTASSSATTASCGSRRRSYFLIGGDSDDLIQEGLVGLYKAVRDYRSDRESSFRNFAELCITRQIITAVKTSTRNKHTPLNEYVSFSQTPAAGGGDGDPTLDELLPGPTAHDPSNQVISTEELHSLVGLPVERALGARELGAVALPGRPQLRGDRRAARVRHEDGGQRAPAREAQGRRAPRLARRCCSRAGVPARDRPGRLGAACRR